MQNLCRLWIEEYFIAPKHFFPYWGLEWIRPWPGVGMYVHFAVMGAAALCVALGFYYRLAIVTFGVTFAYAHLCVYEQRRAKR